MAPHGLRLPRSRGVKEAIVQRALCHALKDSGWSVWRVGQYDARRTQDAGVSDVIAAHRRYGVWFLEVKRESGGVVSEAQRQFLAAVREAASGGVHAAVVHTAEQIGQVVAGQAPDE